MPELYLNHLKSFIKHSVDNTVTSDHTFKSKLFTFDFQVTKLYWSLVLVRETIWQLNNCNSLQAVMCKEFRDLFLSNT